MKKGKTLAITALVATVASALLLAGTVLSTAQNSPDGPVDVLHVSDEWIQAKPAGGVGRLWRIRDVAA